MDFKRLAYKSAGPIMIAAGTAYFIYGLVTRDAEVAAHGGIAAMVGGLIYRRTAYVSSMMDGLHSRVEELEKELSEKK